MQKVIKLRRPVAIFANAAVGGREEKNGPLGDMLDFTDMSDRFGQNTWELAESELSHAALSLALGRAKMSHADLSFLFSGDLQNQCVASSCAHLETEVPFFGIYGACSTCTEGLTLASLVLNAAEEDTVAAVVTTSHNSAAERQFRTPIEYGGQRPPTAQWTATAGGAFLLRACGEGQPKEVGKKPKDDGQVTGRAPHITRVMAGIMRDGGVSDAFNMGAAMAPAAADSVKSFLSLVGAKPGDYDAIVTGDLGDEGSELLKILLKKEGIDISRQHLDCGKLLYDLKNRDCHAGGSGCGCSAATLAAKFLPALTEGSLQKILFLSTGALMSPTSIQQGKTIIGVAPVLEIVAPGCMKGA